MSLDDKQKLYIFDTTLRDGAQTAGVDFSFEEKRSIAQDLDKLGVDYIEGGFPGANPTDTEFFESDVPLTSSKLVAFGMTKRAGRSASNDDGLQMVINAKAPATCMVAKAWDFHVDVALNISLQENLDNIEASVKASVAAGKEAMIDCEHFFDGYKANPDFALLCVETALTAGARWVILCDTNGGTLPDEIFDIVSIVIAKFGGDSIGIHTHDDTGNAVANSLAAVSAGVRQVQGTLNGLGERCGNANLTSLIPTLLLKKPYTDKFNLSIKHDMLPELLSISRRLDELINMPSDKNAPYVGENAFTTKAGIHASAIVKNPATYEHIAPELVGNKRRLLVSNQAGKSNFLAEFKRMNIDVDAKHPKLNMLIAEVKKRESEGYSYESANASFYILAKKLLGELPDFFKVESFRVIVERRFNAKGHVITQSEATVKINVGGVRYMSIGEGNGPVNALDAALRKDLGIYSDAIKDLELVDFKVRILNGGTEATTRVLIESRDDTGERWFTVGVSENLIDASFNALLDSIRYKLMKEKTT
ncbi:MAG: citramalate synthase [Rhizobiales bacterium]|nr:citramalate synthase [Hyphomicrobiales bacterium]NRB13051.1 citramalate synthase [Hyphomicrobiales bacterium]